MRKLEVTFAGSAGSAAQFPRDGLPEVAFLGRSNVGKSSLLNALAGVKNLARVSSTPGRTRTINFFRVRGLGAEPRSGVSPQGPRAGIHSRREPPKDELYLADLPGYGYAAVSHGMREGWERLVTSYLLDRPPLALCVFLVDARHEPMAGDRVLHAFLTRQGLACAVAATKADKLGRGALAQRLRALERELGPGAEAVVGVSAVTGAGVPELWRVVRAAADRKREDLQDRRRGRPAARVG